MTMTTREHLAELKKNLRLYGIASIYNTKSPNLLDALEEAAELIQAVSIFIDSGLSDEPHSNPYKEWREKHGYGVRNSR